MSNPPAGGGSAWTPLASTQRGNLFVRGPSETPQWGPGVVADPARRGDSGSLPLTVNKMRAMNTRSTFSSQRPGRDAAYAVDNSTGTWWEPAEDDRQPSITIDLGPATEFDPVQLFTVDSSRILFAPADVRPPRQPPPPPNPDGRHGASVHDRGVERRQGLHDHSRQDPEHRDEYVEFDELPPTACRFVRLTLTDWPRNAGTPLGSSSSPSSARPSRRPRRRNV